MADFHISRATASNWQRLQTNSLGRLTKRANKTRSGRRIVALSYLDTCESQRWYDSIASVNGNVGDIIYTACRAMLQGKGLWQQPHVQRAMEEYSRQYTVLDIDLPADLMNSDGDVLGFLYQSLITEGERNRTGQYYTQQPVVADMLDGLTLHDGESFLDPCCGSGAFLLGVQTTAPEQLYGYDINPVAVMMARTNLLIKYADLVFEPHVYCRDFLADADQTATGTEPRAFDYIYTNPPWGADKQRKYHFLPIPSGEKSSFVLFRALSLVKPTGRVCCLLPTSLLKIRTHRDIRSVIIGTATIVRISLYAGRFDGVYTDFFSILLSPGACTRQTYIVSNGKQRYNVTLTDRQQQQGHIAVMRQSATDHAIMAKMEALRHDDLTHSQWALGIITGNNKEKLHASPSAPDEEPVYTGRQVQPFVLNAPSHYIRFAPGEFQQCAREALYRAPEKLIYRFIADHPVVAYDDRQRLCLNSANVLIPAVDGCSVKSVCALLNSSLYHYYYKQRFWDIKMLKGNLQQLPFPQLTAEQDAALSALVSKTPVALPALNAFVYTLFGITPEEQTHIEQALQRNV